ncbi:MAG TPA: response regulator transcription factor [Dehalococcoidia bacterium]
MTQPSQHPPIRVLIAGGEDLYRDLLRIALSRHPRFEVVGAYADGESALEAAAAQRPDVALLDLELAGNLDGVQAGILLRRRLPETGIILLSGDEDADYLAAIPRETVDGWSHLLKGSISDVETLARAIEGAAAGFAVLHPRLASRARRRPRAGGVLARLTPRQREILRLIALGFSNTAIAQRLVLAEKSVENQVSLLYQQLGIDRRGGALHPRVRAALIYLGEGEAEQQRASA